MDEWLDHPTLADVTGAAQRVVIDRPLAFDGDLVALENIRAVDFAGIELRLTTAEAHGGEFLDVVSHFEEALAAREEFGAEIGAKSVADHGDIEDFRHLVQLADLLLGQELRLIHEHTRDIRCLGDFGHQIEGLSRVDIHLPGVTSTRSDEIATLGIDHRLHHDHAESALLVVVSRFD